MKKNLFYLFALICSMSLFISCSDDDPDYSVAIEQEIAGSYKGTLDVEVDGTTIGRNIPKNISVVKASSTAINLTMKDFSFMGITIGDVVLSNCKLSEKNSVYTFTGVQELAVTGLSCTINATGTVTNGQVKIDMDIDAKVGDVSQKVKVVYKGNKLSGSESSEAKITSFVFKDAPIVTEQPVIDDATGKISFKVLEGATDAELAALVPTIEISPKAIVSPDTGVKQNFASNVTYTVIAEDGTIKEYVVSIAGRQVAMKFPFDEWKSVGAGKSQHDEPAEETLATSASGASLLWLYGVEGFPLYKETEDVVAGNAAKLVTMDTSAKTNALVPALTSGSVFTGFFNINKVFEDRLLTTEFGIEYDKKPAYFRGWYKYTPGEKFINGEGATKPGDVKEEPDSKDECAIQAVLYEATDADGNEVILTGHTINGSEYHVATAVLADGTAKSAYTYFDLPFTYTKEYDPSKKYKLVISCSSSKEGDVFKGAGGSTLWIDEFEVIGE